MGKKSFALGRGLAAIMKDHDINFKGEQANTINNPAETSEKFEKIVEISIDLIDPNPFQPRKAFDDEELSELADSIKQQGLIQPIALRKVGDRYQIISGERRTRATKIAGLPTIKAQVFIISISWRTTKRSCITLLIISRITVRWTTLLSICLLLF